MSSLDELLDSAAWFTQLTDSEQERVRRDCFSRQISTDGFACQSGNPVEHWLGVIDGLVKMSVIEEGGRAATLAGVPSGGWFGEGSLLKDEHWRYDGICLRDSQIAFVPKATFNWLAQTSLTFNQFLLGQLNERLSQFIAALEHQRLLTPEGRLARCIAQLYQPQLYPHSDPTISFSQGELGLLSGLSRQRVNQALQTLEQAGLVSVEYSRVRVKSLQGLQQYT